jgi:hypothetical protein
MQTAANHFHELKWTSACYQTTSKSDNQPINEAVSSPPVSNAVAGAGNTSVGEHKQTFSEFVLSVDQKALITDTKARFSQLSPLNETTLKIPADTKFISGSEQKDYKQFDQSESIVVITRNDCDFCSDRTKFFESLATKRPVMLINMNEAKTETVQRIDQSEDSRMWTPANVMKIASIVQGDVIYPCIFNNNQGFSFGTTSSV